MNKGMTAGLVLAAGVAVAQFGLSATADAADAKKLRVISEQTAGGFAFPESVAYDPQAKVLYVSQFGGS